MKKNTICTKFNFLKYLNFILVLFSTFTSIAQTKVGNLNQSSIQKEVGLKNNVLMSSELPSGMTATWSNNTLIITAPSEIGEFDYQISLEGNCNVTTGKISSNPKPDDIVTNQTICLGDTFTWTANNTDYTTAQNALRISNGNCTADQVLNLTVTPKPDDIVTNETICLGDTFTWTANNTDYTTAQNNLRISNDNCNADQVLNLTVTPKPAKVTTSKTICSGEIYKWPENDVTYTIAGTYTKENDGCTADEELILSITEKPADIIKYISLCPGQIYPGLKRIIHDGCTADEVFVIVNLPKLETIVKTETICSGTSYEWSATGMSYTNSGTYIKTNDGCTADEELQLTVTPKPAKVTTSKTICSGEAYKWPENDVTYTTAGTYTKANDGCTADQVLILTVNSKKADIVTDMTICSGESYMWPVNNTTYTTTQKGLRIADVSCDIGDNVLNLTVNEKATDVITNIEICPGERYYWEADGKYYNTEQTGLRIAKNGCSADQVLNLKLTTKPDDIVTNAEICTGQMYTWPVNNINYLTAQNIRILRGICEADYVLNLIVKTKPADIVTNAVICKGKTYTWDANKADYTKTQIVRIINDPCTADQILNLTVNPKPNDIITNVSICPGSSYYWTANNTSYTTPKNNLRIVSDDCTADQVLNLSLITEKPDDIVTNATMCAGGSYTWKANNVNYTTPQSGLRISNNNCTADEVLNLKTVSAKPADITTNATICSMESYTWPANGRTYNTTQKGLRIVNDGCTADQVLNLTVTDMYSWSAGRCGSDTFTWEINNATYSETGIYNATKDGKCYILYFTKYPQPKDAITNITICEGENYKWPVNNVIYTTTQKGLRISTNQCESDKVLNLTVIPKPADLVTNVTICAGDGYLWPENNVYYKTAQTGLRIKYNGCNADRVLNLTLTPKPADIITNETIMPGGSYTWPANNVKYTTAQKGIRVKKDNCTADQVLNLTVSTKPADIVTNVSICSGQGYRWAVNNVNYTTSQTEVKVINNENMANQVLNLTVAQPLSASVIPGSLVSETCENDKNAQFTFQINGGVSPYKIAIDNRNGNDIETSENSYTYKNLGAGVHTVYIKDNLNCASQFNVRIPDPLLINPVAVVKNDCVDTSVNSVTVSINKNIINSDVDYSLDGNPSGYQNSNVFNNVPIGTHFIRARHSNGCEKDTENFTIETFQPLTLKLADGEMNEIVATTEGGDGNYQYSSDGKTLDHNKLLIYKSGDYTITVTDKNGCIATETKYVNYVDVCIPNNFTPNGDGINDLWGPGCTVNYKNLTYTIFDRYGRILANYSLNQKWDGKLNGVELPSGDYWYVLKLNDNQDNREFVGHFNLYR